jgi:hypothetical protein
MGIVLPGGLNMYYIDLAPNTEGTMHRTTSTDYLVVISGALSLLTPAPVPYQVRDGKATHGEPVETVCRPGDVVAQRGMMHACVSPLFRPLGPSLLFFSLLFYSSCWDRKMRMLC